MIGFLVAASSGHSNRKCCVVSSALLQRRHVGSTIFWLKDALLVCSMQVPVANLSFVCTRVVSLAFLHDFKRW